MSWDFALPSDWFKGSGNMKKTVSATVSTTRGENATFTPSASAATEAPLASGYDDCEIGAGNVKTEEDRIKCIGDTYNAICEGLYNNYTVKSGADTYTVSLNDCQPMPLPENPCPNGYFYYENDEYGIPTYTGEGLGYDYSPYRSYTGQYKGCYKISCGRIEYDLGGVVVTHAAVTDPDPALADGGLIQGIDPVADAAGIKCYYPKWPTHLVYTIERARTGSAGVYTDYFEATNVKFYRGNEDVSGRFKLIVMEKGGYCSTRTCSNNAYMTITSDEYNSTYQYSAQGETYKYYITPVDTGHSCYAGSLVSAESGDDGTGTTKGNYVNINQKQYSKKISETANGEISGSYGYKYRETSGSQIQEYTVSIGASCSYIAFEDLKASSGAPTTYDRDNPNENALKTSETLVDVGGTVNGATSFAVKAKEATRCPSSTIKIHNPKYYQEMNVDNLYYTSVLEDGDLTAQANGFDEATQTNFFNHILWYDPTSTRYITIDLSITMPCSTSEWTIEDMGGSTSSTNCKILVDGEETLRSKYSGKGNKKIYLTFSKDGDYNGSNICEFKFKTTEKSVPEADREKTILGGYHPYGFMD